MFVVAICIAVAAGKCHELRALGVACEQGEISSLGVTHLGMEFRSQDAKLTIVIAREV